MLTRVLTTIGRKWNQIYNYVYEVVSHSSAYALFYVFTRIAVDVFRIRNLIEEYRKKPTDSGIGDEKPYLDEEVKVPLV